MTRKEVRGNLENGNRSRWGLIVLAVLVAGVAGMIRSLGPGNEADAQVPQKRAVQRQNQSATAAAQQAAKKTVAGNSAAQNIAAVVNGEPITRQYIAQQCRLRWGNETLESLVNKQLITEACKSRGIVITERDIEAEIASISSKFGMSTDQYLKMLKDERDVTSTEYRRDIVWPTIALKRLAADKLTVTKEQLQREYESEYGPKVQVRMISLTSKTKAAEVAQLAKAKPDDFARLAKLHSADRNSASAKGLIPPIRKHLGEPAIEQAVFAMQPGDVSGVIHAANQYFIFKCERHLPEAVISPQFKQQAVTQLRERIIERNLRSASTDIFKQLQTDAKIVNVLNDPKLSRQSPGVAAFVNSKQITVRQLDEECLLRYGRDMLDSEINRKLLTQILKQRGMDVSSDALKQELARAAESFGYTNANGDADIEAWVKAVTEQEGLGKNEYITDAVWPSVALRQLVDAQVSVTDEDLKKGFEANYGQRVEVLAIVLGNQRIAQEVWDMARKNSSKEFFGQLAEQYSVEQVSRANFGEIPPIRRHGGQPQIESEAFRLQAGELSGIVAMGDKFIIMKCLGRTQPVVEKMADVQSELTADIREKKLRLAMATEFDKIRASAQIDNFLAGTSQAGKKPNKANGKVSARPVSTGGRQRALTGPRK